MSTDSLAINLPADRAHAQMLAEQYSAGKTIRKMEPSDFWPGDVPYVFNEKTKTKKDKK